MAKINNQNVTCYVSGVNVEKKQTASGITLKRKWMPETAVVFYRDGNRIPVLDWLKELKRAEEGL